MRIYLHLPGFRRFSFDAKFKKKCILYFFYAFYVSYLHLYRTSIICLDNCLLFDNSSCSINLFYFFFQIKFLLPKSALGLRELRPPQWVSLVQAAWTAAAPLAPYQVKAQVLHVLSTWPLFGSSFFAVKRAWSPDGLPTPGDDMQEPWRELILALNRRGVLFLEPNTHETLQHWPFSDVISTRKVSA